MTTEALPPPVPAHLGNDPQATHWCLTSRVAFRFCFAYFTLYCLSNQVVTSLIPIPNLDIPDPSAFWPLRHIVFWTATHIFHVTTPLIYKDNGSGDKTFDWIMSFCLLVIALLITGIWSALDRKRENYIPLHKWFRLFIRFALAGQMFAYGIDKAVPLQMPFPFLTKLVEPYGNFSPMGVLWSFIGSSPAYEIFSGCAEMLGGILLIIPRTTMLGALICLADMTNVFMLNMAYDTPVKLFSFHLILLSLFLLAPDARRLANLFFLNRDVAPAEHPALFRTLLANRIALILQIVFGVVLVGMGFYGARTAWYQFGGARPKSVLYGIWDVEQLSIDGQVRSPLLNDYDRFRRAIFDFPQAVTFQRMDDSLARYGAAIDEGKKTLVLTKGSDKNWKGNFTFQRPAPDRLTLDGEMDGRKTQMQLKLVDRSKFLLVSRGFHWIQEYPLNR
jgi:uncharacterized membrane protein YphA (DoxX/SURF4 family)